MARAPNVALAFCVFMGCLGDIAAPPPREPRGPEAPTWPVSACRGDPPAPGAIAQQFAYLLQKLDAVQGGRTLLDNTVVWWSSEISIGNTHDVHGMPFVLAGSGGGYFRTGRFLSFPADTPHNRLLVSICNAMGVQVSSFGDPRFTGPCPT